MILIINTPEPELNPFQLAAQGHLSAALDLLAELNQQGTINRQQLLLWARLKEQLAETDSAWLIYIQLSNHQDASGYLSSRELEKWNTPLVFNPDTIYIIDSFYRDHYIRHLRLYLEHHQGIFYLDYNPFFSYPEVFRCSHQDAVKGNFFRQKILSGINFNITWSRLNFIASEPGNFVDFRLQGWDATFPEKIEIEDLRPISYQLIRLSPESSYHLSFQHFTGGNETIIGAIDVSDQSQWPSGYPWLLVSKFENWEDLSDSLKQRINLEPLAAADDQNIEVNDLSAVYLHLRSYYKLIDIPLYRTHFFCRNLDYCINHPEITTLELAKLISGLLSPVHNVEILLVSSGMPGTRYSASPCAYFDRVMVRVDDSIWMDPQLNSPFNYLPASFQNVPALNLYTEKLETLPALPDKFSNCTVKNLINIDFSEVTVQTDISLSGEFYLNLLINRQDEDFILNDILSKHSLAHHIQVREDLQPDAGIISISYRQPLIPHSERYSMIYLYVPDVLLSALKFYQTDKNYIINTPFKISYSVSGNFQLINLLQQNELNINQNWFQFSLNTETSQQTSLLNSEFRLTQNMIPAWKTNQIEQMNLILTQQLFIKTLVVRN